MKTTAGTILIALTLAACGASDDAEPIATDPTIPTPVSTVAPSTTRAPEEPADDWPTDPPPVSFESATGAVEVDAFTVCWSEPEPEDPSEEYESWCADGAPEVDTSPVIVPVDGAVVFRFPVDGWRFSAGYLDTGGSLAVSQIDDTTWSLTAPAKSTADLVVVSGLGPQGDVHVAIALPETDTASSVPPDDLVGETFAVDIVDRCADGVSVGIGDELFLLTGDLAGVAEPQGRAWERGDFPDGWEVEVLNDKPVDGDDWVIRGAEAVRIDVATIEVVDPATGDLIGVFELDDRSPTERFFCG